MGKCEHCRLSFDDDSLISDENGHKFCCTGCKNVYEILHTNGFDEFYERLGKNTLNPVKTKDFIRDNAEGIYENFVKKTPEGFNEIFVVIEGIHCSACVWLNEKVLFNAKGVIEANINATTNKAKIVWDETQTNLTEIFTLIQSIGYEPLPYDPASISKRNDAKRRDFYARMLTGIFCVMNIMWISVALYGGYFTGIEQNFKDILHFAEFVLATPVLFYTGSVFYKNAYFAIKNRITNMDLLIATGASIIYIYSIYVMFSRHGEVYFESVAMIITFVFIGKYLEVLSKKRASDSIDKLTTSALGGVSVKRGEKFEIINAKDVCKGDEILINQGQKVLIDGVVKSGSGSFDYSDISGESIPVGIENGDSIKSGGLCLEGSLIYEASASFENSLLNKIVGLLENATQKKAKIELLVNQIAAKFSFVVISVAVMTFLFWLFKSDVKTAILVGVSVIIIACPCALGLATPISTLVALGVALGRGIIFKEAASVESIAKCDTIVFDKTGTLTKGNLSVNEAKISPNCDKNALVALLQSSNHPISKAVLAYMDVKVDTSFELNNIENIPSKGISALYNGMKIHGGSGLFMQSLGLDVQRRGTSEYFFAQNGEITAKFSLMDEIKEEAKSVIEKLENLGYEIYLLSGDNEMAVKNVADKLGIKNFNAAATPDEKADFIASLNNNGKKTIMVGDGVNDIVALKTANVGIAMGSGADVSIDISDVVLLKDDLNSLFSSVKISKTAYSKIKQNLAISLIYNVLTIPLAVCGLIIPLFAALSMSFSSVLVIVNAMRIRGAKYE